MPDPIIIDITHHGGDWPDINDAVHQAIQAVAHACFTPPEPCEVSVVLASNDFIQNLNKQYRNKDKPTNVLSFPQDDPRHLGDIILALQTIQTEAEAQKKSFENHFIHLVVHGFLHLLGYDHETDEEAREMEGLEIEILRHLSIENPYELENFTVDF